MALIGKNNHSSVLDEDASLFQAQAQKSEKQKWSELSRQQRFRYFIDYYFMKCIAAIALAGVLGTILWTFFKPQKEPSLFFAIVHNPLPMDASESLEQSFANILQTDGSQKIHIDDAFPNSYESDVKLSAFLSAQEIDLIVTNEEYFQALAKNDCFVDLSELMPAFSKEHKGLLYLTEGYTEEPSTSVAAEAPSSQTANQEKKAYGIDITDSSTFKPFWFQEQRAILGIVQNCKQQENAILALEYIVSN